jgi:hypothetical protein
MEDGRTSRQPLPAGCPSAACGNAPPAVGLQLVRHFGEWLMLSLLQRTVHRADITLAPLSDVMMAGGRSSRQIGL